MRHRDKPRGARSPWAVADQVRLANHLDAGSRRRQLARSAHARFAGGSLTGVAKGGRVKLVECVPNFSEGRDHDVIALITAEIAGRTVWSSLMSIRGAATNRTVVTFVGTPEAAEEAAFRAIARASELIDMSQHTGEHPRMGATDVCPFVPIEGTTLEDCVEIARRLGARVGSELGIPVYLYEYAGLDGRRSLADARSGEYEGLAANQMHRTSGPPSTRPPVPRRSVLASSSSHTTSTSTQPIANSLIRSLSAVRTLGTATRDADGKIIKNEQGKTVFAPGRFEEVKGVGWYIDEYDRAQVSLNLTDTSVAPMHEVFEACREEASPVH